MSEIYVIVGPPRSGSSLVAGILHKCGVPMFPAGKAIYDNTGDEWNPGGHFADADFHAFMTKYLTGLQLPSEAWSPDGTAVAEIQAMVAARSVAPKWGFKGLHAWIGAKVLSQQLGQDVRVIRTLRSLGESQASFEARTGEAYKADAATFVGAVRTAADAFYASFTGPKQTVSFDSLFDDTSATVASIATFAGVTPTAEAVAFVNPDWRRF